MKPKIIAIVGPTASGKTSFGIEIAKRYEGEIISVDSRQIYQKMNIGTAKAVGEWKGVDDSLDAMVEGGKALLIEGVAHWGIDLVSPDTPYSAADFKKYAEKKIDEILKRGKVPVLVGGTGFWLQALIDNYTLTETASDDVLRANLEEKGKGELFAQLKRVDPKTAEVIDRENKRKLVRALEVYERTGVAFSSQQNKNDSKYSVLQLGLSVEREVLVERINFRVDQMIAEGLVDEVRDLEKDYGCEIESMTSIGYRQICMFLQNKISLKEAVDEVKKDTRRYAKRQMTWFRRDDRIVWVEDIDQATSFVNQFLLRV